MQKDLKLHFIVEQFKFILILVVLRDTGYTPVSGEYEHIAFQRDYSGNTLKMYANGVEKWSVSNQVNYNSTVTYVNIGSYNIGAYGHFQGYISNLRIYQIGPFSLFIKLFYSTNISSNSSF